jgi:predicted nucleic acid-binding protein
MTTYAVSEMSGMTDQRRDLKIYFDANAFIYAVEGVDEISNLLRALLAALQHRLKFAFTSEFSLAEVLPKANVIQRRNYLTLILHSGLFELLPVTRDVLIETADYRQSLARHSAGVRHSMPRLPDAIHVVTALRAGCNVFVSFDRGLKLPAGLDRVGHEDGRLAQLVEDIS